MNTKHLAFFMITVFPLGAQQLQAVPQAGAVKSVSPETARLGQSVFVELDSLEEAIERDSLDPSKLLLYLDDRVVKGAYPVSVNLAENRLEFELRRSDESKEVWRALLGSPNARMRPTKVGVGFEDARQLPFVHPDERPTIGLVVFSKIWLTVAVIGTILTLVAFGILAIKSDIIRDASPPSPPIGTRRPYSLARVQMAVWFFLVVGSFVFLYLITGAYDTITEQALILIGIGTGTALGAAALDANKVNTDTAKRRQLQSDVAGLDEHCSALKSTIDDLTAKKSGSTPLSVEEALSLTEARTKRAELAAQLAEKDTELTNLKKQATEPESESFVMDLLTDVNGVSFHRFQMLIWTVVLGFLYCVGVYQNLAMPEFSATLLSLMGISSGTYLGFKVPERQT